MSWLCSLGSALCFPRPCLYHRWLSSIRPGTIIKVMKIIVIIVIIIIIIIIMVVVISLIIFCDFCHHLKFQPHCCCHSCHNHSVYRHHHHHFNPITITIIAGIIVAFITMIIIVLASSHHLHHGHGCNDFLPRQCWHWHGESSWADHEAHLSWSWNETNLSTCQMPWTNQGMVHVHLRSSSNAGKTQRSE